MQQQGKHTYISVEELLGNFFMVADLRLYNEAPRPALVMAVEDD
jgi:hypothetical protein